MKKKLSLLMVALVAIAAFAVQQTRRAYSGESPYSYSFSTTAKTFIADGTETLGGVDWTLAVTWTGTQTDYNKDGDGGMKIGSNNKSVTAMSLTSAEDAFGVNYITSVKVTTAARSGWNPALTVTVGGVEFKYVSGDQKLSSAPVGTDKTAVYEFVGVGQGAIVLNWDGSKGTKGAIYVKQIDVVFQADAPAGPAVVEPVFSVDGGTYVGAKSVEITCATEGATIYYTTDGETIPSAESTEYTAPISVAETMTIKAIAIKGDDKSEVATASYTILEKINGGTAENPLTIAQAIDLIDNKAAAALAHADNKLYVKGLFKEFYGDIDQYNQLSYWLTDGKNDFEVYQGKYLENAGFDADSKAALEGKMITVYGNVKKYTPKEGDPIYEFDRGNYVINAATAFSVSIATDIANGTVLVDKATAVEGDEVTITATPAEGYQLLSLSVVGDGVDLTVPVSGGKFTMPAANVIVSATFVEPEDITISPEGGDINEALAAATAGKIAKIIEINLTKDVTYTVSATIEASASVNIYGNGATIDASALEANMIQWKAKESTDTKWTQASIQIEDLTVKGLKKALFYSNSKYYCGDFMLINSFIEQAGDATTFDYTKGSVALNFVVAGSTIYAPTATTKSLYSSQGGQKATEFASDAQQNFIFSLNTMYNLAKGKNFFTHRQSNQTWLTYTVQNNIFVNCGKSGQVIKGMNGGQGGANPTWTINGNAFNFDGADTSANESTGDTDHTGDETPGLNETVQNSVAGVITFNNVETPDFGGTFKLAIGATAPEGVVGDKRWTVDYKETGAVLWSSEEPATIVWDQANIAIPAEKFANAKVGDVMHVMLQDVPADAANTWDSQVELRGQNWKALEASVFVAGTASEAAKTVVDFVLTGDILAIAKELGVQINGQNCKTALITLEYADEVAGSDLSIWVGSLTKGNVSIDKAHFANSNLFNGVKIGDKIRVTVKKTDAESDCWIGMNYLSTTWAWSSFDEGSFAATTTETADGAIVEFEVKTEAAAKIMNEDNVAVIVNNPNQTVTQVELIIAPVDIVISPEEGADIYTALKAETDKVAKVGNIYVYLAPGKKFTISQSIVAPAAFVIMGAEVGTNPSSIDETATMAEIDASTLTGPLVQMSAEPAVDADANGFYPLGDVGFLNVKVTGLTQQLFYANKVKYLFNCFHLDFCNINIAGGSKTVIDTNGGGVIATLDMSKNTIWAEPANTGALYSSQGGQKATEAGLTVQTFNIERNTIYNIAYGKNFCSHRQSNQTWLTYNVRNNVFVNCGKSGQLIKGLNGGQGGANPTWNIDDNVFNFDGADTSANESTGDADEPVKNSLAGIFEFTDAATGDFNGVFKGKTAEAPAKYPGDPRWTYTYEIAPTDIVISPESGADIAAALSAAKEGILKVGNITINLAENGAYTVSAALEAPASVTINGNSATIDASSLEAAMITTPAGDLAEWMDGNLTIKDVTIKGVNKGIYASAGKNYLYNDFLIENSVIEITATGGFEFDFRKGGVAKNFTINRSTIYAPQATGNSLYTSQSGQKATEAPGVTVQTFAITNSTLYNIAKGKNFFTHRQNGQKWLAFTATNSIFVNVGKSGQVMQGMNGGSQNANPIWTATGNIFNFDGADTSVKEHPSAADDDVVKNSVAGIIKFQDAAAGDFTSFVTLAPGTETAPESVGDPRWTLNLEMGYAIAIGEVTNGTMTVSATYAAAGDKIYPTMTPAEGYAMDKLPVVKNDAGEDVTASISFGQDEKGVYILMPAFNITVSYEFSKLYNVTLPAETTYGTVTLVNGDGEAIADTKFVAGKEIKIKVADLTTGYKVVATSGETEITLNEGDHTKFDYYFTMPEGDVTISIVNATGINSIAAGKMKNATIYNMKGQRVDKAQKGLYIINGKKVVVK